MIDADDSAFPIVIPETDWRPGIDVRTYIATKAMAALIASDKESSDAELAKFAVHCADALIAELNAEKPE